MEKLYLISPNKKINNTLKNMIEFSTNGYPLEIIRTVAQAKDLSNKKLLFVAESSVIGYDLPMINFLWKVYNKNNNAFEGSTGALLISSVDEEGTKRLGQDIIYIANNMGCSFIGHPMIEAIDSLKNFLTWQKTIKKPLAEIAYTLSSRLVMRLMEDSPKPTSGGKLLVLYSMPHKTSNTLDLWHMVSAHLDNYKIKEVQIESGQVLDCVGCPYKVCMHYGKNQGCFYGGIMTKDIIPAIKESDAIVWLCPNYNDAISANLTAVINRITALYRQMTFYNKSIFAVIVSGNSGSDSIAKQLIGALNINKGFKLPAYFSIRALANDPRSILQEDNIFEKSKDFSDVIKKNVRV